MKKGPAAQEARVGVYICHCGANIADRVDVESIAAWAATIPGVVVARDYKYVCSDAGQELIRNDIAELGLDRVVVASCSPRMHEPTFRRCLAAGGLNPYLFDMANIREQCSWVTVDRTEATAKAKALVAGAVARVRLQEPLEDRSTPVYPAALVLGGGITGIEAALRIAHAGFKVALVEREPSIGGVMAQFDKTFPTMDCAACILTPKMAEAGSHPNIRLFTWSEVEDVSGFLGDFKVTIRKRPRYVDPGKCTACGDCEKVCPVEVPNPFDQGMSKRKAIFRHFPQAVPNTYQIEKKGVAPCRSACPAGVNVQGYIALTRVGKYREAWALITRDMPFPAICGRVCPSPCESQCRRGLLDAPVAIRAIKRFLADVASPGPKDSERDYLPERVRPHFRPPGSPGRKVAVVGSGPAGLSAAYYLAARGHSVTVLEKEPKPGGLLRYGIPAFRLPPEILDSEIDRLRRMGVEFRANTALGTDLTLDDLKRQGFAAVLLAVGAGRESTLGVPGEDLEGVRPAIAFLKQVSQGAPVQVGRRVAVIGGGNAAVDAARVARRLGADSVTIVYRRSTAEMPASPAEVRAAQEEGVSLITLANPVRFLSRGSQLAGVEFVRMELLPELDSTGRRRVRPIPGSEFTLEVDTAVVAIGQSADLAPLGPVAAAAAQGGAPRTLPVDQSYRTGVDGVFAAGDVVSGPATVVSALAQGRDAAFAIDA
ncbi:MAG: FAD-dependent oxidoreductase, partial [Acetobacteraceae bacterium]|nr:FAD-dependent oxidoreductase [Acetobacteraceae bacterium]